MENSKSTVPPNEQIDPWIETSNWAYSNFFSITGVWSRNLGDALQTHLIQYRELMLLAWSWVQPELVLEDLWTIAQMNPLLDKFNPWEGWEATLSDPSCGEIDREGAKRLLPKIKSWDPVTRLAVLRVVMNALASAAKASSPEGDPLGNVIANEYIEAEFRQALMQR